MNKLLLVKKYSVFFCLFISLALLAASCVETKKATYFNNIGNSSIKPPIPDLEPVIQLSDLLSIYVSSLNPEATLVFNTPNMQAPTSTASGQSTSGSIGYLVSQEGNIQFPVLGSIKVAGLTKKQLTELIAKSLLDKKLLIDPIVTISFLNYRVTVLGEVGRPTVITVANEKISLLEAIGLAGDLTIFARRDNVLLIREENGQKTIRRINLTTEEIFTSPYYYLKTNDVVYIEPNKSKVANSGRAQQVLPIVFSALSLIAIVVSYLIK
ncbi:MAG: polysaccharide biosynthesis/export family protein [Chitinophagaceae bacterium]